METHFSISKIEALPIDFWRVLQRLARRGDGV